jgi:hypothetical protein
MGHGRPYLSSYPLTGLFQVFAVMIASSTHTAMPQSTSSQATTAPMMMLTYLNGLILPGAALRISWV